MFEGFESFIENKLDETAQKEFIINNREPLPCERVHGTELDNGFFAYNNGSYMNWCLCDINSGTLIQGHFNTLAEVKDFVINMDPEFMERINNARNTEKYKLACEKVIKEKDVAEEAFNSYSFKEALDILNTCPINTLVEDYQPITGKSLAEKTKASKTFWNYANADRYGREIVFDLGNFHIAYDDDMARLNLLDVFTDDGKLKDRTIWDRIKQADDNSYAIKALSKVAKMQFSMGMKTKEEAAVAKKEKEEQEKREQDWRDKLALQKNQLIADRTNELQTKIPELQQEVFKNLDAHVLAKISAFTGGALVFKPEDIILIYEVDFVQNGRYEEATFKEQTELTIKLRINGKESNNQQTLWKANDMTSIEAISDVVNDMFNNLAMYLEKTVYNKRIELLLSNTLEWHLLAEGLKGYSLYYKILDTIYALVYANNDWKLMNKTTNTLVTVSDLNNLQFTGNNGSNLVAIYKEIDTRSGHCYIYREGEYAFKTAKLTDDQKKLIGIDLEESSGPFGSEVKFTAASGIYSRLGFDIVEHYIYEIDSSD